MTVWIDDKPARLKVGDAVVVSHGHVNRNIDANLVRRIHLRPQQIEFQRRMHHADLCGMVAVAMMTAREAGY